MAGEEWETALEIVVRWGNLEKLYGELGQVGAQAKEVERYAVDQVFNKSGFEYRLCVLQPLAEMMDACAEAFGDLRGVFDERWEGLSAALAVAARELELADGGAAHQFLKPYLDIAEAG